MRSLKKRVPFGERGGGWCGGGCAGGIYWSGAEGIGGAVGERIERPRRRVEGMRSVWVRVVR